MKFISYNFKYDVRIDPDYFRKLVDELKKQDIFDEACGWRDFEYNPLTGFFKIKSFKDKS